MPTNSEWAIDALTLIRTTSLVSMLSAGLAFGQTPASATATTKVEPAKPVPGDVLKIENVSCGPDKSPAVVLDDNLELTPVDRPASGR
jgi:hypothetical protein